MNCSHSAPLHADGRCSACVKERRQNRAPELREQRKRYRAKHREKLAEYQREYVHRLEVHARRLQRRRNLEQHRRSVLVLPHLVLTDWSAVALIYCRCYNSDPRTPHPQEDALVRYLYHDNANSWHVREKLIDSLVAVGYITKIKTLTPLGFKLIEDLELETRVALLISK